MPITITTSIRMNIQAAELVFENELEFPDLSLQNFQTYYINQFRDNLNSLTLKKQHPVKSLQNLVNNRLNWKEY